MRETDLLHENGAGDGESFSRVESFAEISRGARGERKEEETHILALGLSSRKNLCVNPKVSEEGSRESVDARCRNLTASWVRDKAKEEAEEGDQKGTKTKTVLENEKIRKSNLCEFYEDLEALGAEAEVPKGVYTLQDLRGVWTGEEVVPVFSRSTNVTESERGGV